MLLGSICTTSFFECRLVFVCALHTSTSVGLLVRLGDSITSRILQRHRYKLRATILRAVSVAQFGPHQYDRSANAPTAVQAS